jgi:hypothetical protein
MVYNEPVWAKVWVRHYAGMIGAGNCLVLDHGTTDGSTADLGVAVETVPRGVLDEAERARIVSDRVARLLERYDAVVHTDADELLIGMDDEPQALERAAAREPVVTAVGLDLQHLPDEEPALDPGRPIGVQRRWVRFSGAMCKPALVRRPVRWTPGFHGCDAPARWGGLYLLHLRYADLGLGLKRLRRSRSLQFAGPDTNTHQRVPDEAFEAMMRAIASLPREEGELADQVRPWRARMDEGWGCGEPRLGLAGDALWLLPWELRRQV